MASQAAIANMHQSARQRQRQSTAAMENTAQYYERSRYDTTRRHYAEERSSAHPPTDTNRYNTSRYGAPQGHDAELLAASTTTTAVAAGAGLDRSGYRDRAENDGTMAPRSAATQNARLEQSGFLPPEERPRYRSGAGGDDAGSVTRASSTALRLLDEMQRELSRRMAMAGDTARAVRIARETIDAETMLAQAKAEADAWREGQPNSIRAQSQLRAAQNMSPLGVRAVIAERDELRYLLRKAAAELSKVESATGGGSLDMASLCQVDLERLASIKSQVNLEQDHLTIRQNSLESTVEELFNAKRHLEYQLTTYEEQIGERSETIIRLDEELRRVRDELSRTRYEADETLKHELEDLRNRLRDEARQSRDAALQEQEAGLRADKYRELETQRQELENRYANILDTKLAEQRHALLSQAAQDKADALQQLQSDMQMQEEQNLERLRSDLTADKERALGALRKQMAALKARYESELDHLRQEAESQLQRLLAEQQQQMRAQAEVDKHQAVQRLRNELEEEFKVDKRRLQEQLEQMLGHQAEVQLKRELERQRKALINEHKRQQKQAADNLRQDLDAQHQTHVREVKTALSDRKDREFEVRLKRELETERRRAANEVNRSRAGNIDERIAELKQEKIDAVEKLRTRLGSRHERETEELRKQLAIAKRDLEMLRKKHYDTSEELASREAHVRQSHQMLREELRKLHANMKIHMGSRMALVAPADGSTSGSMQGMLSLVSALGQTELINQPEPSIVAKDSPDITVDILFHATEELLKCLADANREVEALQNQLHRDRVLIRKQVEDDVLDERMAELNQLRVELEREGEIAMTKRMQEVHHKYDIELERERKEMDERLKEFQAQSSAQQRTASKQIQERLEEERTALGTAHIQQLQAARVDSGEKDALQRRLNNMERQMRAIETDRNKQAEEIRRLTNELQEHRRQAAVEHKKRERTDATAGRRKGPSADLGELQHLRAQVAQQAKERLRMEKTIANLQAGQGQPTLG